MDSSPNLTDLPTPDFVPIMEIVPELREGAEIFSRFVLQEELGCGRCSTSWLVDDPRFRRSLVLKLYRSGNLAATAEEQTIWREYLRHLRILNHPDIVMTMEFFHESSRVALTNAYENGKTLADLTLKIGKKLPQKEVEDGLKTIGLALVAAYEKFEIVHGNLNPYNILVSNRRGTPKICDFGFHPPLPPPEVDRTEREIAWKLACLSPERLQGEAPSHRDDLYAFAALAFQMFTGKNPPLKPDGSSDRVAAEQNLADISENWRKQLLIALSTAPAERQENVADLLKALNIYEVFTPRQFGSNPPISPVSFKKKQRPSKSPLNDRRGKRLRMKILTFLCLLLAPVSIGYIIYKNNLNEKALQTERLKAEVLERELEAKENAEVLKLSDSLGTAYNPSQSNLELYRRTMNEPVPTPKPKPIVINSGAKDFYKEGQAKLAAGDPSGAMESYELAVVLQSNWPDLLEARGDALLADEQPDEAILEYGKALIIEPNRVASLIGRAKAHFAANQIEDGKSDLLAALKLDPDNVAGKALAEKNSVPIFNEKPSSSP